MMKNTLALIGTVVVSLFVLFVLQGCTDEQLSLDETIMIDRTEDSFVFKVDSMQIRSVMESERISLWKGANLRILPITDIDFNYTYQATISPACEYLSNLYERKNEKGKFLLEIDTAIQKILEVPAGRDHSSIYKPLATELKRLSESTAQKRRIYLFSDLMENTSLISFYNPKTMKALIENHDSIKKSLEGIEPLPKDLSGIEIFIIYEPRDAEENGWFDSVSTLYKNMLEQRGAKVFISANILL